MNKEKAIKLAIKCIKREVKRICVDANLHDLYGANYPYAMKCSEYKKELLQAIKTLEELIKPIKIEKGKPFICLDDEGNLE